MFTPTWIVTVVSYDVTAVFKKCVMQVTEPVVKTPIFDSNMMLISV